MAGHVTWIVEHLFLNGLDNMHSETLQKAVRITNPTIRIALSEFIGTFFLCLVGNGAVHCSALTGGSALQTCFAFGMSVTFGVYISCSGSGGHINPAVSIAMASLGRLGDTMAANVAMFGVYTLSQIGGAFLSSFFVWFAYSPGEAYLAAAPHNLSAKDLTGLYATWPTEMYDISLGRLFYDQALGTFILVMVIFATTDSKNASPGNVAPIVIGIAACVIGLAYGVNGGGGINPARDLGPRLFALCMFGSEALTGAGTFFWIPLLAPLVGGVVAAFTYLVFISAHHMEQQEERQATPQKSDYVPVQLEGN